MRLNKETTPNQPELTLDLAQIIYVFQIDIVFSFI